ncbi:MAG: hypothetical protein LBM61_06140 [Prevotellaceae bacterium]|jgi:hypothetical protein|nr:hypothetical protein [Prevotellaceae bacterium]
MKKGLFLVCMAFAAFTAQAQENSGLGGFIKELYGTLTEIMGTQDEAVPEDGFEVSLGADVVSSYIWRGQNLGGVSIQPSLAIGKNGFSLSAWGSIGLDANDAKEFDLTLGYETGGFSVALTDYWVTGGDEKYFTFAAHRTAHVLEGTLGYDFGFLALTWNTNIAGADYYGTDGKRAYSSYAEIAVPFTLGGVDFGAELGVSPWKSEYYGATGFNLINVGLGATKELNVTPTFSLPLSVKVTCNPKAEQAYFVFGISF